jgi:hypothetical protein
MVEPITAIYVQENDDWAISVASQGEKLTGRAPGIIAARDRVDQLVQKLAKSEKPTVVHLLNGSALAFTSMYMTARLTRSEPVALDSADNTSVKSPPKRAAKSKTAPKPTPVARKPRPRPVSDISNEKMATVADVLDTPKKSTETKAVKPAAKKSTSSEQQAASA